MKHVLFSTFITATAVTVFITSTIQLIEAQVMSSTGYEIQSDSINIGGGLSVSDSYISESTVGEIATGPSDSSTYRLRAGYQQMQEVYLSMTPPTDVEMTPQLGGLSAGTSNGSTTITVITDSPAGYQLVIAAENNPAMQSPTATIADYVPSGGADFSFTTSPAQAHFGFSPSGVDIVSTYRDNESVCGTGSLDTLGACWGGLSTTPITISQSIGANHPTGATTTLYFRVGVGGGAGVESGVYTATTTVTALPL